MCTVLSRTVGAVGAPRPVTPVVRQKPDQSVRSITCAYAGNYANSLVIKFVAAASFPHVLFLPRDKLHTNHIDICILNRPDLHPDLFGVTFIHFPHEIKQKNHRRVITCMEMPPSPVLHPRTHPVRALSPVAWCRRSKQKWILQKHYLYKGHF